MKNPDLAIILMDIQLPVMDGYSSTKKIKESGHSCKIVAQTAYSLADELEKIRSSGFDDYIIKPIFADQLIDKLSLVMLEK